MFEVCIITFMLEVCIIEQTNIGGTQIVNSYLHGNGIGIFDCVLCGIERNKRKKEEDVRTYPQKKQQHHIRIKYTYMYYTHFSIMQNSIPQDTNDMTSCALHADTYLYYIEYTLSPSPRPPLNQKHHNPLHPSNYLHHIHNTHTHTATLPLTHTYQKCASQWLRQSGAELCWPTLRIYWKRAFGKCVRAHPIDIIHVYTMYTHTHPNHVKHIRTHMHTRNYSIPQRDDKHTHPQKASRMWRADGCSSGWIVGFSPRCGSLSVPAEACILYNIQLNWVLCPSIRCTHCRVQQSRIATAECDAACLQ